MTELIVALDGFDPLGLMNRLRKQTGARWFKIGPQAMVYGSWSSFMCERRADPEIRIFLDLKLCDTKSTVREAVKRFAEAGIAAVSTFTDEATEAALDAAPATMCVWQVEILTDAKRGWLDAARRKIANGVICPGWAVQQCRDAGYVDIVVPGIRLGLDDIQGDDAWTIDPRSCPRMGVTHAIVGRPIWAAPYQIAAYHRYRDALQG